MFKELATIEQKWIDATIQNNFVFGRTMETNPELCRRLIEKILNVRIEKIDFPEREKISKIALTAKVSALMFTLKTTKIVRLIWKCR